VITGVRRCGKSSLLHLIMKEMQLEDSEFCYFNFDDERISNEDHRMFENLDNLHKEMYNTQPVFFLDEIQNIDGWEKFINRKYEEGYKIFVTGSNASLLSSEISSSLTGRNKVLSLMPFSFKEFLKFKDVQFDTNRLSSKKTIELVRFFNEFFATGGFPLVIEENDLDILDAYFKDILYRDIIVRNRLQQVDEIKQIGLYFFSNISKLFSYKTLQKISGIKSTSSVKSYLDYYNASYLFYYLKKFDFSVKKQILNNRKVYCIDQGLIKRLGYHFSKNKGRVLENIVYLELIRREKEVFYYDDVGECDFVIKQGLEIVEAIQVVYLLNKESIEREIKGLVGAMNNFKLNEGLLIYYDIDIAINEIPENIKTVPIWSWLLAG
jgi:predicted AAA+ superfamily ATPase